MIPSNCARLLWLVIFSSFFFGCVVFCRHRLGYLEGTAG
jgi:hypothetical protein